MTDNVGVNKNHVFRIAPKYGQLRVHIEYSDLRTVGKQFSTIALPVPDAPSVTMTAFLSKSSQGLDDYSFFMSNKMFF